MLAAISKIWIKFEGKARDSEKAESRQRRDEQYSLSWPATQPSSFRRVFEMASNLISQVNSTVKVWLDMMEDIGKIFWGWNIGDFYCCCLVSSPL
ncbi:MAG: hypothetical protein JSU83_00105, partial [Deltaproteobacteria bacterium]